MASLGAKIERPLYDNQVDVLSQIESKSLRGRNGGGSHPKSRWVGQLLTALMKIEQRKFLVLLIRSLWARPALLKAKYLPVMKAKQFVEQGKSGQRHKKINIVIPSLKITHILWKIVLVKRCSFKRK